MNSFQNRYEIIKRAIIVKYLADRLEREQSLTKYFNSILNVKYIELKRHEKRDELLIDLDNVKQKSERLLSSIESFNKFYLNNIQDYDKLSEHVTIGFLIVIDELIIIYKDRLKILRDYFEDELATLVELFENDKNIIENKYCESFKDIDDYMVCLEFKIQDEIRKEEENFLNKKETIIYKQQNEIRKLKLVMENKLENLEKENKVIKVLFESQIMSSNRNPQEIIKKNNKNEVIISNDKLKIKKLNAEIEIINKKIDSIESKLNTLDFRKDEINKKILDYKQFIINFEIYSKDLNSKLINLIRSSSNALNKLRENYKKISKIFAMIKYCRQLEKKTIDNNSNKLEFDVSTKLFSIEQIEIEILQLNEQSNSNYIDNQNSILLRNFFNIQSEYSRVAFDYYSHKLINQKLKKQNITYSQYLAGKK
jgi:hypothetical protein